MISVAAIRMQQFGVQFYQASLSAADIDKLVRFEVLSYGEQSQPVRGGRKKGLPAPTKVNWDLLERRIGANEKAYQRQIIRKKIDELVQYYEQCRQARDLPSIPGAVIISCDERLRFEPMAENVPMGTLKVPEREGILRAARGELVRLEVVDVDDLHDLTVVLAQLRRLRLGDEADRERLAHLAGQVERRDASGLDALDTDLLFERFGRDRELQRLLHEPEVIAGLQRAVDEVAEPLARLAGIHHELGDPRVQAGT